MQTATPREMNHRGAPPPPPLRAPPAPSPVGLFLATLAAALACNNSPSESTTQPRGASNATPRSSATAPKPQRRVGETVDIGEGTFWAGSVPGEAGRDPSTEPRRYEVELGPFRIDRLAYPNDPKGPPRTSVSFSEAQELCATSGARLCTDLEWERACKGPESQKFAGGDKWRPSCAAGEACESGFGVAKMGALREWTLSTPAGAAGEDSQQQVVRGAAPGAPEEQHRCAARRSIDETTRADDLGFRCCRGAPNAAQVRLPKLGKAYEKSSIKKELLEKLLKADPRTEALATELVFFREPDAARTVLARGTGDTQGFNFTVAPLLCRPKAGSEFLAVTARSGKDTSFVVVYYVLGKEEYQLASSFVMQREPGPIAFAYSNDIRPRFHFSSCWGCPTQTKLSGETGKILFRDPDEVVILQP